MITIIWQYALLTPTTPLFPHWQDTRNACKRVGSLARRASNPTKSAVGHSEPQAQAWNTSNLKGQFTLPITKETWLEMPIQGMLSLFVVWLARNWESYWLANFANEPLRLEFFAISPWNQRVPCWILISRYWIPTIAPNATILAFFGLVVIREFSLYALLRMTRLRHNEFTNEFSQEPQTKSYTSPFLAVLGCRKCQWDKIKFCIAIGTSW